MLTPIIIERSQNLKFEQDQLIIYSKVFSKMVLEKNEY